MNLLGTTSAQVELMSFPNGYDGQNTITLKAPAGYVLDYLTNEIDVTGTASVGPSIWKAAAGGSWNSPAKWTGGVPNGQSAGAVISQPTNAKWTITLDAPQTVGTLVLGAGSLGGGYTVKDSAPTS